MSPATVRVRWFQPRGEFFSIVMTLACLIMTLLALDFVTPAVRR